MRILKYAIFPVGGAFSRVSERRRLRQSCGASRSISFVICACMKRSAYLFSGILALALAGPARGQDVNAFEQDPLADGVVCIEAEHYHSRTGGTGVASQHAWTEVIWPGASGGVAMQALPDTNDVLVNAGYVTVSPRLDYVVNFNRAGTHYIVLRGEGEGSSDDSLHVGLNGLAIPTSDRVTGFIGDLPWSGVTMDGNARAEFDVPAAGTHTVNLWMREDGLALDKFVITANSNFVPAAAGPPESLQGNPAVEEEEGETTLITGLWMSNEVVGGVFTPAAGVDLYRVLAGDLTGAMAEEPSALVYGFEISAPAQGGATAFYGVEGTRMPTNRELTSIILNRLAYGPTPDELDRVATGPLAIGPDAYIQEQLQPEVLTEGADAVPAISALQPILDAGTAHLEDLRAWYCLRAIAADRQFLEILTQFVDNLFVTYYWKTRYHFTDTWAMPDEDAARLATALEYRELARWREVLLDPNGTFYDLLRVSAESPAMIIYLDTVGNDKSQPNENYSREIMELFCMGVDNGYDQSDIEAMSPCWTGWRVGKVHPDDADDPHAPAYSAEYLIPEEDTGWSYFVGQWQPPGDWLAPNFAEDTNWLGGQTSIGFGDNDDNTLLPTMRYNQSSVYLRKPFVVDDPAIVTQLHFGIYVDDGCIVWVNSQEVARVNVNPAVFKPYNGLADASVGDAAWADLAVTNLAGILQVGTNVLAVHALNASLGSSDFSIDTRIRSGPEGVWSFVFDPDAHDTSNKVLFAGKTVHGRFGAPWSGRSYELALPERTGTEGVQDGYDIVAHLANLPYTAEFISARLCALFVNEDFAIGNYYNISQVSPEAALIRDCMVAWETPAPGDGRQGNLREVLKVIFASDLFRSQSAAQQKVKSPFEYVISAVRALRADLGGGGYSAASDGYDFESAMSLMGMELFARAEPDGWPETGRKWIDTGTVNERLRFIQNLLMHTNDAMKELDYGGGADDNVCNPVALLMARLPGAQWNDPYAVTDYFVDRIFPGVGYANLDLEREECVWMLDTDDAGNPSPFSGLAVSEQFGSAYNDRVRALVGLLLANPRFHEQ